MSDRIRNAGYWKEKLQLTSHPEGGAYGEIYRAAMVLPQSVLTTMHNGDRNAMTSIYFLLGEGEYSAFHRIASDELWHHYDGDTLCVYEITPDGVLHTHFLGLEDGAIPFAVIKAGSWFASRVAAGGSYTLCGCTVAPGFDFADFELANRTDLQAQYPQHAALIAELTP
ncbi:cupin domain-containing protein [Nemorincola caseinilytica]|uniref:Cupin domain-containing protein n=1 Tax=Nemorincola caseinilytica TaxID=2054315 RepID=A0ABP8N820_9BACT